MAKLPPFPPLPETNSQIPEGVSFSDRLTDALFVGREREMTELRAGLESACSGRGRLVLLAGEPGIGKTRTAHQLAHVAGQRNVHVLTGRCSEDDGAPPFWPWIQIVRSHIRNRDLQTLQTEMGTGAADIAQVIAEVREKLPDLPVPPALEPQQARFRFFDSFTTFLKNAARTQPLLLILDDLHAADTPSLLLLRFLAQELRDAYLLVIGTYRDVEMGPQHPLMRTLGELAREHQSHSLLLRGLSEPEVARFIELSTGVVPSETVVAAVYKQTEGNPFFVTELVRLFASADDRAALTNLQSAILIAVPLRVREAISHRLLALSQECRDLLTVAAVIGREVTVHMLEAIEESVSLGLTGEPLLAVLDEAVAAHLLMVVPQGVGRYIFSHALIRETLYEMLSTPRRVRLHRQIGETLERVFRMDLEHHLAELAYHFFQAAPGGDVDKAITYTVQAGERATALLAYEEAVGHYEHALQLLELTGPHEVRHCELLLALGDAQRWANDTAATRATFERAAELARKLGPRVGAREAASLLGRAALGFTGLWVTIGVVDEPVVALLEEALRAVGEEDLTLRARLLARLALELWFSAPRERKAGLCQEAMELARRTADAKTLAYVLYAKTYVLWEPQNFEERLAAATEIMHLARRAGDWELAEGGYNWRITGLLEGGDIAALDAEIAAHARLAEELRQPVYLWHSAVWKGMRALLEGRFAEGEQLAQQAFALGQRAQRPQDATMLFGIHMFTLRREQGRLQELEAALRGFAEQYPAFRIVRYWLACLYSEIGCEEKTQDEFEALATHDFADLPQDVSWLMALAFLSQACTVLGDTSRATKLYALLLPYAGRSVVYGNAVAYHDSVSHHLGLLAAILGRWDEARTHFEMALACNVRLGARPRLAHSQYEYARILIARKQPGDQQKATGLLSQALATAQKLGMAGLVEKIKCQVSHAEFQVEPGSLLPKGGRDRVGEYAAVGQSPEPSPQPSPVTREREEKPPASIFRLEGDYWTIAYQGAVFRLKDARGGHYLAHLLHHPHQEFHVFDLVALKGGDRRGSTARATLTVEGLPASGLGDAGELLDRKALAAYKQRLADLQAELQEARAFNDSWRAERLRRESDFLTGELVAGLGLRGRQRKAASAAEQARVNVTRAIKRVIEKIDANHQTLGLHLRNTVNTGLFCSYSPDPRLPISWQG